MVAMLTGTAFAAEGYTDWSDPTSMPTSGTYRLTTNVDISTTFGNGIVIRDNLVLDLNGHTLTITGGAFEAITVRSGDSLTIEDSSGGGKITNGSNASSINTLIYANGGSVTLKGGALESSGGNALYVNAGGSGTIAGGSILNSGSGKYALYVNSGSKVEMTGGEIQNNAKSGCGVYVNSNDSSFDMAGGSITNTVNGADALYINGGGSFSMSDGKIVQQSTYASDAAIYANNTAASIEISGGNITSSTMGVYAAFTPVEMTGGSIDAAGYAFQTRNTSIEPAEGSAVEISSEKELFYTFSGSDNKVAGGSFDVPGLVKEYTSSADDPSATTITGGTFPISPVDYVPADSAAIAYTAGNGSTNYVVGDDDIAKVAQSATEGDEITVLAGNVDLSIPVDGVTISNEGSGDVTVNGADVNGGDEVVTHIHHAKKTEAKDATCTEDGNIAYWYCAECGKYFSDGALQNQIQEADTKIPATNDHTAGTEWKSDETSHWKECTSCGTKLNQADHTFAWVIDRQATATQAGAKHQECTVCKYAKAAVEIPATGTTQTPSESDQPTQTPSASEDHVDDVPKTGDSGNMALWICLFVLACGGLTGVAVYARKRKAS